MWKQISGRNGIRSGGKVILIGWCFRSQLSSRFLFVISESLGVSCVVCLRCFFFFFLRFLSAFYLLVCTLPTFLSIALLSPLGTCFNRTHIFMFLESSQWRSKFPFLPLGCYLSWASFHSSLRLLCFIFLIPPHLTSTTVTVFTTSRELLFGLKLSWGPGRDLLIVWCYDGPR